MTDTTTAAVGRLAGQHDKRAKWGAAGYEEASRNVTHEGLFHDRTAATLRALAAERDAAKSEAYITRTMIAARGTNRDYWEATATAALAREARLREALAGLLALDDPYTHDNERMWRDAFAAARAALASDAPT